MIKANVNTAQLIPALGLEFISNVGGSTYLSEEMTDVNFGGQRIAIINGVSAPLQWTAKNGSNIPLSVIEYLEAEVVKNLYSNN